MNERPIGLKNGDPNEGTYMYLCPNGLLLGKATTKVPPGRWSSKYCFKRRRNFIQQAVDSFWMKWMRDFFPTLIIRQKWHTKVRHVKVNDVILIQESNVIRGHWELTCTGHEG